MKKQYLFFVFGLVVGLMIGLIFSVYTQAPAEIQGTEDADSEEGETEAQTEEDEGTDLEEGEEQDGMMGESDEGEVVAGKDEGEIGDNEGEEAGADIEEETVVDDLLPEVDEEPVIDDGLVAYWKFEGNAEEEVNDFDGVVMGDAEFVEGIVGQAINFDAVDDFVELPESALGEVGVLSEGTIAFWFTYESLLETQTIMPIFYIGADMDAANGMENHFFVIEIGHLAIEGFETGTWITDPANKKLYVGAAKNNEDDFLSYETPGDMEENIWYHFAFVMGETGNKGYLNGEELSNPHYWQGSSSLSDFIDDITRKERFTFGYGRTTREVTPEPVYYKGAIDELLIYDRVLSAEEIASLAIK